MAHDGREGLEKVYQLQPAVLLLDVQMPVLDGPSMMRRLDDSSYKGQLAVVLMSASPLLTELGRSVGAAHLLRKPFDLKSLLTIVRTASDGHRHE